jgi:hypothetical protein
MINSTSLNEVHYIDGSIDGSIATYIQNCGLSNILSERHAESGAEIPNTHLRGSKQIDVVLATPCIALFIQFIGLLDFDVIFQADHRTLFIDINMEGFFGSATETLPAQRLRQLQLEDPRVSTEYRKILQQQLVHHSVFRRIKEQSESNKSREWNMVQESKYEALDRDITWAMLHDEPVCLLKHKHNISDIGTSASSEAEYMTKMIHCWITTVNFLMLKQSLIMMFI